MSSANIPITGNDIRLLRPQGLDKLSLNQHVVAENQLQFILKTLEIRRSEKRKKSKKLELLYPTSPILIISMHIGESRAYLLWRIFTIGWRK